MKYPYALCIAVLFGLGALSGCASVNETVVPSNATSAQILAKGNAALTHKKYQQAIDYFESLSAHHPLSPEAPQGMLKSIYAYYLNDQKAFALAAAERYIHWYPQAEHVDYAYYMKGLMYFLGGHHWTQNMFPIDLAQRDLVSLQSAFEVFSDLHARFPNSVYASDACQHLYFIRNVLAKHILEVAQFYMQRKAYVAAADRAKDVVLHFSQSPQVLQALQIMIDAYTALGNPDMAGHARAILLANQDTPK